MDPRISEVSEALRHSVLEVGVLNVHSEPNLTLAGCLQEDPMNLCGQRTPISTLAPLFCQPSTQSMEKVAGYKAY